ncbi:MAG: AraC family transcriptional regulator [Marinobacter sp.]|uniref:AraC family transcriptional regulator n=1 Tax=Marinobacter sp. TaxID=50741 RepID=UPI00299DA4FD|nr:AraC family transcriptional regulator [Marinobacter sp.]MDX1757512.1 AraC family transcriptional regulator [Marinobacter sp.]
MDRLAALLSNFHLSASVFNAGALCHGSRHPAKAGTGYVHILTGGTLHLAVAGHRARQFDEPVLILLTDDGEHWLGPGAQGAETLCGSFRFGLGQVGPIYRALPSLLAVPLDRLDCLSGLLELMLAEVREERCGRQATLDRLCEVLVIQLLRYLMDSGHVDTGLLAGLAHPKLAKAFIALHNQPAVPWTLTGLASEAGMSRARFAKVFRDTAGQPPGEYLALYRLGLAQAKLRDGVSLDAAASQVGYSSASALAKVFRRHTGLSPIQWRNLQCPETASDQKSKSR